MHSVLLRQLKRLGIDPAGGVPTADAWQALLERVGKTYEEADQDRYTLERSLVVSSRELQELHQGLGGAQAQLTQKNEELKVALAFSEEATLYLQTAATELERRVN